MECELVHKEVRGIQSPNLPVALVQDLSHKGHDCIVVTRSPLTSNLALGRL